MINVFFSKEECDEISNLSEKYGVKSKHNVSVYNKWDNRKIYNEDFKYKIYYINIFNKNFLKKSESKNQCSHSVINI